MILAQATQPTIWTPAVSAAVTGALILIVGALAASLVAVIKAGAARLESKLAAEKAATVTANAVTVADTTQKSLDRLSAGVRTNAATIANVAAIATPQNPPLDSSVSVRGGGSPPAAMLLLLFIPLFVGCANQTPAQKVYLARQAYIGTEQGVTALIRAKVITNTTTLDAIEAARNEARDALADADAKIGTLGFDFVMSRVESALGRFAQFYLDHKPAPAVPATQPGATLWTPPRSPSLLPASPRSRNSSHAVLMPSRSSNLARTSRPRNRTHYVQCRAQRTPTSMTL